MSNLKLHIVDYKQPELYFRGFLSDAQAGAYGFQLQRMFDFNNAVQGEYLVVLSDDKPFAQFHVERSNCYATLVSPEFSKSFDSDQIELNIVDSYSLVLEHLKEFYQYTPIRLSFEIELLNTIPKYSEILTIVENSGYEVIESYKKIKIDYNNIKLDEINFQSKPISDLSIDKRFDLVYQYSRRGNRVKEDALYQDYLEMEDVAEELWRIYMVDDKEIGYILYGVDTGFKKTSTILDIRSFDESCREDLERIALAELKSIGEKYESSRFIIDCSSSYFSNFQPLLERSILS